MRGHIKQRAKGTWSLIIDLGRDPATGKRRQQWSTVRGTKKEAEARLTELLRQVDTGGFVKPTKLTVGEFLEQWLRDYATTNVRSRTLEGYVGVIERHLVPRLGNIALSQLQPSHLQAYYRRILTDGRKDGRGGLSSRSVLQHHRIISEALSHAVRWGLLARNVAQAVDSPRAV